MLKSVKVNMNKQTPLLLKQWSNIIPRTYFKVCTSQKCVAWVDRWKKYFSCETVQWSFIWFKSSFISAIATSHIRREHWSVRPVHRHPLWHPDTWRAYPRSTSSLWTLYRFACIWSSTSHHRIAKPQRHCSLTQDSWECKEKDCNWLSVLMNTVFIVLTSDRTTVLPDQHCSKNVDIKSLCLQKLHKYDVTCSCNTLHYTTRWDRPLLEKGKRK